MQDKGVKTTDDSPKYNYSRKSNNYYSEYEFAPCIGTVLELFKNKQFVNEVKSGENVGILLDKTNFYAEQGGQIYDEGFLVKVDDEVFLYIILNFSRIIFLLIKKIFLEH